ALERLSYDYCYIAPETLLGTGVMGPRADLYALGCVAYELVCGKPPFVSDNYLELAASHMHKPIVVPSGCGSKLGASGDEVLLKLLARSPEERYSKVEEASQALDQLERCWRVPQKPMPGSAWATSGPSLPLLRDASMAHYRVAESIVGFDPSSVSV